MGASPTEGDRLREALEGRTLANRYRLLKALGAGGFGIVFEAEDTRVKRRVAVKVLLPEVSSREQVVERFEREAVSAGRLDHEGIVAVTDFDRDEDGSPFFVMEYIEGPSLAAVLRDEAPLSPERALAVAARIAQATAAAHAEGIVHRDLKPANVLLTAAGGVVDFPKVVDFGVAKILEEGGGRKNVTDVRTVVGTPLYMAPEQATAATLVDGRADVYSLGVILYEMLTGAPPFRDARDDELVQLKLSRDPPPPSSVSPEERPLPRALDRLVLRALEREPSRRYPSMSVFDREIREVLEELSPEQAARVRPVRPILPPTGEAGPELLETVTENLTAPERPRKEAPAKRERPHRLRLALAGIGVTSIVAVVAFALSTAFGNVGQGESPKPEGAAALAGKSAGDQQRRDAQAADEAKPTRSETVELELELTPSHATAELDGVRIDTRTLVLPRSDRTYELVVEAPGYVRGTRQIRPLASGKVRVDLQKKGQHPQPSQRRLESGRIPDSPL